MTTTTSYLPRYKLIRFVRGDYWHKSLPGDVILPPPDRSNPGWPDAMLITFGGAFWVRLAAKTVAP